MAVKCFAVPKWLLRSASRSTRRREIKKVSVSLLRNFGSEFRVEPRQVASESAVRFRK